MTVEELLEYFKSGNKFGKATGFSRTNIPRWKKRGVIPHHAQVKIENMTGGALKAHRKDEIKKEP